MIHATHCGGAHRVITHSTLVGSGSGDIELQTAARAPWRAVPLHVRTVDFGKSGPEVTVGKHLPGNIALGPGENSMADAGRIRLRFWNRYLPREAIFWPGRITHSCRKTFLKFRIAGAGRTPLRRPWAVVSLIHSSSNPSLHWKIWGEGLTLKR